MFITKKLFITTLATTLVGCGVESNRKDSSISLADADRLESWNPGKYSAVSLAKKGFFSSSNWCSGVVISNDTILTAAHCVAGNQELNIHFGEKIGSTQSSHIRKAERLIPHPKFKMERNVNGVVKNDIGLVKFSGGLPTGYRPIPVYQKFYNLRQGLELIQVGYGRTSDGSFASSGIRLTNKSSVNNLVFSQEFGYYIQSGLNANDEGVCKGDSGGPAYAQLDGAWYLVGVVSSSGCASGKRVDHIFPGFYSSWIYQ